MIFERLDSGKWSPISKEVFDSALKAWSNMADKTQNTGDLLSWRTRRLKMDVLKYGECDFVVAGVRYRAKIREIPWKAKRRA